jgi:hypothetical protein
MIRLFRDLGIGLALLPLTISTEGFSAVVIGNCQPTEVKYAASSSDSSTESQKFLNVREASISFAQGGTNPSCVIVHFSGESRGGFGASIVLRPLLDGATLGLPEEMQFAANDANHYTARTVIFIFQNVLPGTHRLDMQYKSVNGNKVNIGVHNTLVHYTR